MLGIGLVESVAMRHKQLEFLIGDEFSILKPARTRMAPIADRTRFHLADSARTALYSIICLHRKTGGQFVLRLEDTDLKRFVSGSEEGNHATSLRLAGNYTTTKVPDARWDRTVPIVRLNGAKFISIMPNNSSTKGHAYPCFCTPERLEKSAAGT
ncbi:MAG: glutamate--tRNA ligase family protein [Ignavibacteriales bacterium]|nr:glutamate--tRNA ligase family protein [Ignavibacteriales bacterium]